MEKINAVRYLPVRYYDTFQMWKYPNFHKSGSITEMRKIYGKSALLVRCGEYIYNVHTNSKIYWNYAH